MKNIIKSIVYEILHSKMLIRTYLLMLVLQVLIAVLNLNNSFGASDTSTLLADGGIIVYEFPIFMLALIVGGTFA